MKARELQWMVGYRVLIDAGSEGLGVAMLVGAVLESQEGVIIVDLTGLTVIVDESARVTVELGSRTSYFVKIIPTSTNELQWCVMHRFEGDIRFNENFGPNFEAAERYCNWMNREEQRRRSASESAKLDVQAL